ncbi:hypothetical protein K461DRAFT_267955 [Myriangium duriaei CBS 260.36]|uniref:Uncharacterized protein n=1 Tax=Myriangium duriaei CBS 260.36 TaxID=1168546 RepID=A0A9P4MGA4_9PEZI|nr:hypothetical protein K461DRAFT_267955 [Myriangium duriaei CBS 260.36]
MQSQSPHPSHPGSSHPQPTPKKRKLTPNSAASPMTPGAEATEITADPEERLLQMGACVLLNQRMQQGLFEEVERQHRESRPKFGSQDTLPDHDSFKSDWNAKVEAAANNMQRWGSEGLVVVAENNDLKQHIKRLKSDIMLMKNGYDDLEGRFNQMIVEKNKAEIENNDLKDGLGDVQDERDNLKVKTDVLLEEIVELKKDLSERQQTIDDVFSKMRSMASRE